MTDDEYTLGRSIGEGIFSSILATPFILGCYVLGSTALGHVTTTNEYFIVCATTISLIMAICLLTYAAHRPDKQVEIIKTP